MVRDHLRERSRGHAARCLGHRDPLLRRAAHGRFLLRVRHIANGHPSTVSRRGRSVTRATPLRRSAHEPHPLGTLGCEVERRNPWRSDTFGSTPAAKEARTSSTRPLAPRRGSVLDPRDLPCHLVPPLECRSSRRPPRERQRAPGACDQTSLPFESVIRQFS